MKKITILLADDHTVMRKGLRLLLQNEPDFEIRGEAETGRQAVDLARRLKPDVVVMDISMPQLNGLEATRQICKHLPDIRVLILSCHSGDDYVQHLTAAGAAGYLGKETACDHLIKAVREVQAGNAYFSTSITKRLLDHRRECELRTGGRPAPEAIGCQLTSRQTEVLQLVAEGNCNKQTADVMGISIKTVEKHRQNLMDRLNIHDTAGLTRYAFARGIIAAEPVLA